VSRLQSLVLALSLVACTADDLAAGLDRGTVVVTFNVGTTQGLGHDNVPDDGYGETQANDSDLYYGDGLAWLDVMADLREFFVDIEPDIVAFQEIFHSPDCAQVPDEAKKGFVCESYRDGDRTVAQWLLGEGWQVACHQGKNDKCVAVRKSVARIVGCDEDLCLNGLAGAKVEGCGSGSRVGRAVLRKEDGSEWTVVSVHGSSGLKQEDQACRTAQFAQVFEDLGNGEGPAADGEKNIILGDLNTDPILAAEFDPSAAMFLKYAGEGKAFRFISEYQASAAKSYGGFFNIDHVVSDAFHGGCRIPGLDEQGPPVSAVRYFDHKPVVCELKED
jgi:hypothetical protein